MLARSDIAEYLLDNYGSCDRDGDCYWGKDSMGRFDGCLRVGWKGQACKHWHPLGALAFDDMQTAFSEGKRGG